ncbi:MAG: polysaccharide deacetylase family protein [Alicyclobacillaceae bacterium]|nr:polysaccharide deacetylase family protein [Alicyclobacillaceae bacterium]
MAKVNRVRRRAAVNSLRRSVAVEWRIVGIVGLSAWCMAVMAGGWRPVPGASVSTPSVKATAQDMPSHSLAIGGLSRETLEPTLTQVAKQYGTDPVDARVDRVWRAIPGLCGWSLDIRRSLEQTLAAGDGWLHLSWKMVVPRRTLASLPAEPVYRGPAAEKSVCLMFNVSWGEAYLPSILSTLQRERAPATFFLDGAWVAKHPDLARQIASAGFAVGSHGTGHPDFRRLSPAQLEFQVAETNRRIESVCRRPVEVVAPPAGSFDRRFVQIARRHGLYTILWTADTVDWRRPPAAVIIQRAVGRAEPGALILMHPTEPTAQALPAVIRGLRQKGYLLKTVPAVVHEQPCVRPPQRLPIGREGVWQS